MKNDDKGMSRKQLAADMKADRKQMASTKKKPAKKVARTNTVLTKY